jgi:hypothetical protein
MRAALFETALSRLLCDSQIAREALRRRFSERPRTLHLKHERASGNRAAISTIENDDRIDKIKRLEL